MKTKAQVFEELIRKVLHKECELAPAGEEEEDGNVQRASEAKSGEASVPTNADNRRLVV
jgi:hypothetical protein